MSNVWRTTTKPTETPDEPDKPDVPEDPVLPDYPEEVKNILSFNEIMYDNATDGAEYIEFYNPGNNDISIPALKLLRYIDTDNGSTETKTTVVLKHPDNNQNICFLPTDIYA